VAVALAVADALGEALVADAVGEADALAAGESVADGDSGTATVALACAVGVSAGGVFAQPVHDRATATMASGVTDRYQVRAVTPSMLEPRTPTSASRLARRA
jgi:hypothetical protein